MSSHWQDAPSNKTETDHNNNHRAFLQVPPIWSMLLYSHLSGKWTHPPWISLPCWGQAGGALLIWLPITFIWSDHPWDNCFMLVEWIVLNLNLLYCLIQICLWRFQRRRSTAGSYGWSDTVCLSILQVFCAYFILWKISLRGWSRVSIEM